MKLAVVGATGRTGSHVVVQALARGHEVTALARHPEAMATRDRHLTILRADVLEPASLLGPLAGQQAVVSALGVGTSRGSTVVYSKGVANILASMGGSSISRMAVISAVPVGPRAGHPVLERRIIMPALDRFFGPTYDDMRRMERALRDSEVNWTSLRPPRLVDRPATGSYRLSSSPLSKARSMTFADLATALLDTLEREDLGRQAVFVAN